MVSQKTARHPRFVLQGPIVQAPDLEWLYFAKYLHRRHPGVFLAGIQQLTYFGLLANTTAQYKVQPTSMDGPDWPIIHI